MLAETTVYYLSKQTVRIHKRLLLRNHLEISALVRDTLRPVCENLNYERKVTDYVLC